MTGGSRGIGRAVAKVFAAAGDRVAIHHRDSPLEAQQALAALDGDGHVLVKGDVANPEAVASFVTAAADGLGGIDVLVNGAAVLRMHDPLTTSYLEWRQAWREAVEVDLLGTANVSWCVARHMVRRGQGGRIVTIGARSARGGVPEAPAYAAATAGLIAMGQSLAVALAPYRIAVSSVAPEPTGQHDTAGQVAPTPAEIASAVRYLASAQPVFVSGTVLDVAGKAPIR
ncbi:SDR family NAD(P)-dependent oxidoreductase [Pseudonocardia sp. TRM90224]|uniref:SDR family NAD(P)-dependent oxidoreductase n=1 Tax=Pseudonocardia sp. TRM90224 TaxID=2812678 RepID=UPI001E3598A1|nr:SDR family oxidoreductase [Pseudonocardia sp. TRM90224]